MSRSHTSSRTTSGRTMLITCTTALIVALVSLPIALYLTMPSALAGARKKAPKRLRPKEEALVELGRRLFFEPLVSRSGQRSCASCHDPEHGFSDAGRVSEDDFGRTRRHSQTLLDTARNPSAHWDGEFENVEELVLARIGALKGRKGKLGHGATVLDLLTSEDEAIGDEDGNTDDIFGGDADETTEGDEELIDDGEETGDNDDDDSYSRPSEERSAGSAATPNPRSTDKSASDMGGAGKSGAAPTTPVTPSAEAAPAAPAGAPPPAEGKAAPAKAAPAKGKADAGKADKKDAEPKKKLSAAALKAKAARLRTELRKLPLAEHVLESSGRYAEAFEAAFGNSRVSSARMARAIAAYCDSIESGNAAYDHYTAGEHDALSASAKRGLALFQGRAQCASCHSMEGPHPTFTDFAFHNTGVVWDQLKPTERAVLRGDDGLFRRKKDDLEAPRKIDGGRARISTLKRDLRAFKTPTLRDVTRRGPYMHDGRFKTLEDVVSYYAKGGGQDVARSHHLKPFDASKQDVADLVAFLGALTSEERPGLPHRLWRTRTERTRLRFVDDAGKALAGLRIQLTPAGDWATSVPGKAGVARTHTTDTKGWIEFPASAFIQTRLSLPDGLVPAGGSLVPDTCDKATVVVPVRGRVTLLVGLAPGVSSPATLAAEHQGTFVLPGHDAPRTLFQKKSSISVGTTQIVRYEGWLRTDVPRSVLVRLPGRKAAAEACRVTLDPSEPARINIR